MTEFALPIDGTLSEIRHYDKRPVDIPRKNVSWHPVVRDEGPIALTRLENGSWLVRAALPTLEEL